MTLNNTKSTKIFLYFLVSILYFSCENSVDIDAPIRTLLILQNKLNFGNQHPFQKEQKSILLKNTSSEVLSFSTQIVGTNQSEFSILDSVLTFVLKPYQELSLIIQFIPIDTGYRYARLQFSNDIGKSNVDLEGYGYLYGPGHPHVEIEIKGFHFEKLNDSIVTISSYFCDYRIISWNLNKFNYSFSIISNSTRSNENLNGELSLQGDVIKYLSYVINWDTFIHNSSGTHLANHSYTNYYLSDIPYYPSNSRVLYKICGKDIKSHINISRNSASYKWINDSTVINGPKSEYISSVWNDSSYIQIEFH